MSSDKHLHIICFDIPYPVNYGAIFDVFYKIKSLHRAGIQLHVHCFDSGRGPQEELNKYAVEVNYYKRRHGHQGFSFKLPYIVGSRIDPALSERLLQDDYPILMEGIQSTYLAHDPRFRERKIVVREQHLEYSSYRALQKNTWHPVKRFYYAHEARLLKDYEERTVQSIPVTCVSESDKKTLQLNLHARQVMRIPFFLPFQQVKANEGIGSYCLYHGNLSVPENEQAAFYLLNHVFNDIEIPFVITGKNPSRKLLRAAKRSNFHCLVENPKEAEMQDMIEKAQINILPSFNRNGIKLKLLNALFNGRHCVVNTPTVDGSGLESATHIASSARAFKSIIAQLYHQPFGPEEITLRKQLLEQEYNNELNANRLIQWIW